MLVGCRPIYNSETYFSKCYSPKALIIIADEPKSLKIIIKIKNERAKYEAILILYEYLS